MNNNRIKSYNGNIKGPNNFTITQFNKGSSYMKNALGDLGDLVGKHVPSILMLDEANVDVSTPLIHTFLSDYSVEVGKCPPGSNRARIMGLVKNNINYVRRSDLEPEGLATIILQVKISKFRIINIIGWYKQWQVPNVLGSRQLEQRKIRLKLFLDTLRPLLKDETIILSDTNINTLPNREDYQESPSIKSMWLEFLEEYNMCIHNNKPTHFKPNIEPTCIDHIWGNCPNRISNFVTQPHYMSPDHWIVKANLRVTSVNNNTGFYRHSLV